MVYTGHLSTSTELYFNYINFSSPILEGWAKGKEPSAAVLQPLRPPPQPSQLPPQALWRTKPKCHSLVLKIHWPKLFTHKSMNSFGPSFISALKLSQKIKGILSLSLHNIEIKPDLVKMTLQKNKDETTSRGEALVAFTIKKAHQASTDRPLLTVPLSHINSSGK